MPSLRTDRFGRAYKNVICKNNKNGYPVGYFEVGSKLFRLEPGLEQAELKTGEQGTFIKITEVKKQVQKKGF